MLTYNALLTNTIDYPPSPSQDGGKRHQKTDSTLSINDPNAILSTTDPDAACDCDSYQVNKMACPCSARHAARMGRRATERILHRSPFFESRDLTAFRPSSKIKNGFEQSSRSLFDSSVQEVSDDESSTKVEVSSGTFDSPSISSFDRRWTQNKIVELDPSEVEVIKLLGQGGFCEVHAARLVVPEAPASSPVAAMPHHTEHKLHDDLTATSMTASHSHHSSTSYPNHDEKASDTHHSADTLSSCDQSHQSHKKLEHLLGRDYCIKFLRPSVLVNRKKFARGTADLCIEAHFLAVLSHPHILRLRGVTEGFKLFNPGSPGSFLRNLTHYAGREGCCFVLLDKLETTLDEKISGCWKHESDKLHGLMYKVGLKDTRGSRRRALKLEILTCAIQVAEALRYLHDHNIIYRDLKPDNIGFDSHGTVKLFDFGLVKELKVHRRYADGTYLLSANTGSRRYMAPEVAKKERYNLSADAYSFAILLWEICSLEKPFESYSETEHTDLVLQKGKRPKVDSGTMKGWPSEVIDIMKKCWDHDLHKRPSFREILEDLKEIYKTFAKGQIYISMEDQEYNDECPDQVRTSNLRVVSTGTDDAGCCGIEPMPSENDVDYLTVS